MKELNGKLKRNKSIKQSKGITLIALVITIIVLLILAGVTVAILTGDNGLISKSGEAKKQAEISDGLEQLEIAVTQSANKRGNIDTTKLAKNLSKINGIKYINSEKEEVDITENTEIELTAKVKLKGYNYKINNEGNVSYKKEGMSDNEDIMESPATYYGHYVTNYNSPYDAGITEVDGQLGKWQIFMADEDNIYLIASNFITQEYTGKKNNVGYDYNESKPTVIWFYNILNQYNANSNITDIPEILSKLDKQSIYHKWMNTPENQIKNYSSEKAVLSMLDIDVWKGYNNTTYAKYAIGGPTVEMFCKSYNDTHINGTNQLDVEENTYGYAIVNTVADLRTGAVNSTVNDLLFKSSETGWIYRLSSPSASSNLDTIYVMDRGIIRT